MFLLVKNGGLARDYQNYNTFVAGLGDLYVLQNECWRGPGCLIYMFLI